MRNVDRRLAGQPVSYLVAVRYGDSYGSEGWEFGSLRARPAQVTGALLALCFGDKNTVDLRVRLTPFRVLHEVLSDICLLFGFFQARATPLRETLPAGGLWIIERYSQHRD